MQDVAIHNPDALNEFEVLLVMEDMKTKHPNVSHYTITPGNDCVWVYWGSSCPMNLYYIFREGRIADVMID